MLKTMLSVERKAFIRSLSGGGKSVMMWVRLGIYLLVSLELWLFGTAVKPLFQMMFPGEDPLILMNRSFFYFLLLDINIRLLLQQLPEFNFKLYTLLPVKRATIAAVFMAIGLFSYLNIYILFPLIGMLPSMLLPAYGIGLSALWITAIMSVALLNHLLMVWIKLQNKKTIVFISGIPILTIILLLTDHFQLLPIKNYLVIFSKNITFTVCLIAVIWMLAGLIWLMVSHRLRYVLHNWDKLQEEPRRKWLHLNFSAIFRNNNTPVGLYLGNELKLIVRNKRTRQIFAVALVLCIYLFYMLSKHSLTSSWGQLCFFSFLLNSVLALNYGQYMYGWQGEYMDLLMLLPGNSVNFIKAEILLLYILYGIMYIVAIPFAFIGYHILLISTAVFIFNLGISAPCILFMANRNKRKIKLNEGSIINWGESTLYQTVFYMSMLCGQLLLYVVVKWLTGKPEAGIMAILTVGLAGLVLRRPVIKSLHKDLMEQKQFLTAAFKSNGK
ncbi:DUF5687 family protein [Chitinophaga sp. Cy-1792]|uniref:DUF5687 family protein n=1 Tax=Chitinophaga sp. Cy-1792 TaxID=2608339 RepID=UPI0014235E86|nr:DUF5687 family protein [Chitinophaga sp. Cy-1792]NIG54890.1 hypothetical protein [Chitinophaga sp. Cy-1792]